MKEELIKAAGVAVEVVNQKLAELAELRKAKAETDAKVAELKAAEKAILDSEDVEKLLKHRAKLDITTNKSEKQATEINAKVEETVNAGIAASYDLSDLRNSIGAACKERLTRIILDLFGPDRKGHELHTLELCEDWILINRALPPGFSKAHLDIALEDCGRLEAVLKSLSELAEKENF